MAGIQFEEDQQLGSRSAGYGTSPAQSVFTRFVISTGLAKDEKGAAYVLLAAAIVIGLIAIGIFLFSNGSAPAPQTPVSGSWPRSVPR